jgi:lysophospholipase L1-like esterase
MPTLNTAQSATVTVTAPNGYITVDCSSGASVEISWTSPGSISGRRTVQNISEDVGPFADQTVVTLYCTRGAATYTEFSNTAVQALVSGAGNGRVGAVTPYRLAVYGDSRPNVSATHTGAAVASGAAMLGEKTPVQLCMLRGDMQVCFNGGISGDTAVNWASASRASSTQNVAAMLATNPDLCLVQYGINDLIAGTSAATILASLQALADKVVGAGVPFVFESTNTAAAAAASYINGYSSGGGFGASAASKLAELRSVRDGMRSFLAQYPASLAVYVDTSAVSDGADGYAKTDQTYYDGTHMSRRGCRAAAAVIDGAISGLFPRRPGVGLKLAYPNGMNYAMLSPTSGRAARFSAIAVDGGTATATYEVGRDGDGNYFQQYNVAVTALASGSFAIRCDVLPDWVGAGFYALAAGDVVQCAVDYMVDDGSGGAPIVSHLMARQRIYYDDATNEFTQIGNVAQIGSNDYPAFDGAESGRCITPRQAVKAGKSSANMLSQTALQFIVYGTRTGTFRLRLFNPQWTRVA